MSVRTRVGVVVSGRGSNLAALLDAAADPQFPAEVALVVSNRRECGGLDVARGRNIEALTLNVKDFNSDTVARDRAMVDAFRAAGVELVVCAGYDRVLSPDVLSAFPDAILNIHPSLLPAFGGGMHAVEDALAAGVKVTGCTVHLVVAGAVDDGPIVLQAAVPVLEDDDAQRLHARIREQEWQVMPMAVALWATGRIVREGARVRILSEPRLRQGVG